MDTPSNFQSSIRGPQSAVRNCLVIGGAGFIGRHVTRGLAESGREVIVVGRSPAPAQSLPPGCSYICGDYGNRELLQAILRRGMEVVDMAYATVPKTSYGDPVFDLLSNVPPGVGLLQEAMQAGVRRLLVVSSGGTVYGPAEALPIREDHPTVPLSPYGITKLTVDLYAMMFHRTMGLPVVVVRPANAYGEEQRARQGQGFIAAAVDAVLHRRAVDVFGVEGTVRDYIHASDVATGILAALDHGQDGEIYNIGTGVGTTNAEVLALLEPLAREAGLSVARRILEFRHFDVQANVLDNAKLGECSSWRPAVSLPDGLARVWEEAKTAFGR